MPGPGQAVCPRSWPFLVAPLALLPSVALAQGGNIGEGPGWGMLFLVLAAGSFLLPSLSALVALLLISRGRKVRGRGWAIFGAFALPVPAGALCAFVAAVAGSFFLYVALLFVIQAGYVGLVALAWRRGQDRVSR